MSIASEITRLQGVKADILTAIADKGVTVPTGSALDDCPQLISDIPSGGGGISCVRAVKNTVSRYFEIPVNIDTRHTFEVGCDYSYTGSNSAGIFQCRGSNYYPELSLMLYATNTASAGYKTYSNASAVITKTLSPNQFKFYHIKIYSTDSDTIMQCTDDAGNTYTANKGSLIDLYTLTKISLFIGDWTNNDLCQGNEIYYFRVKNGNNVILDLSPKEVNGVLGFYDNVSNTFYGPNVDDGAFEAVEAKTPLP